MNETVNERAAQAGANSALRLGRRESLALLLLVIGVFLAVTLPKVGTAAMKSDATLSLYAAQRIADGRPPYTDYIIMHPPVPHLVGAAVLTIGRGLEVSDAVAMKVFCILLALAAILAIFFLAEELAVGLGALAAAGAGWTQLMLMTVWGMEVKVAMLAFLAFMLLALVKRRWLASGVLLALAIFSWGGGIFFLAIAIPSWLLSRNGLLRSGARIAAGFVGVATLLAALLAFRGALDDFGRQYGLTIVQYMTNKLTGEGIRDPGAGLANIWNTGELSQVDLFILLSGVGALLFFVVRRWREVLSSSAFAALALAGLVPLAMVLADYQSPFDMIPLIPAAAVSFAFLVSATIRGWVRVWKTEATAAYPAAVILMLSVLRLPSLSSLPVRLPAQTDAAEWMTDSIAGEYPIQVIGDLSLLVLGRQTNSLPVIHAGPKTYLAMKNLGWSVERFVESLEETRPGIIVVDMRNTKKAYLTPFTLFLLNNYIYVGQTVEPTTSVYASPSRPEALRDAIGYLQLHRGEPEGLDAGVQPLGVDELSALGGLIAQKLDEFHLIFAYDADGELTLYWWSQEDTPSQGWLGLRWMLEDGTPAGDWSAEPVNWLPGYSSRSQHALPSPVPGGETLEICILARPVDLQSPVCAAEPFVLTP